MPQQDKVPVRDGGRQTVSMNSVCHSEYVETKKNRKIILSDSSTCSCVIVLWLVVC